VQPIRAAHRNHSTSPQLASLQLRRAGCCACLQLPLLLLPLLCIVRARQPPHLGAGAVLRELQVVQLPPDVRRAATVAWPEVLWRPGPRRSPRLASASWQAPLRVPPHLIAVYGAGDPRVAAAAAAAAAAAGLCFMLSQQVAAALGRAEALLGTRAVQGLVQRGGRVQPGSQQQAPLRICWPLLLLLLLCCAWLLPLSFWRAQQLMRSGA
jgi:hypothetical protein